MLLICGGVRGTAVDFNLYTAIFLPDCGGGILDRGPLETDMSEAVRNKAGDIIKKLIPMRRLGKPEDIARVAVFLASEDGGYMTGQVLTVDGGLSLGAAAV